jgi:hypothetical protein
MKHAGGPDAKPLKAKPKETSAPVLMEQMSRVERNQYLSDRLRASPRYKAVIAKGFTPEEQTLFEFEYREIIKAMDPLNEAEEQMLFTALQEYVLSIRAGAIKAELEKCFQETLDGMWKEGDSRFCRAVPEKYSKEQIEHSKRYESLMQKLKLSREQRLDKVKDTKKTLVDAARDLMSNEFQAQVADEIERMELMADKELLRMVESGYIYGMFGLEQPEEEKE